MAVSQDRLLEALKADFALNGIPFREPDDCEPFAFHAAWSIRKSLLKKWEYDRNDQRDAVALATFLDCQKACEEWALRMETSKDEILLNTFSKCVEDFWYENGLGLDTHPTTLFGEGRTGPGAARLARGEDFYTKLFSSPLSCSNRRLYNWYRFVIDKDPLWKNAEETRRNTYGDVVADVPSCLSFVAKNDVTSRTIATEPSLNAYFQQGVDAILRRRLKRFYGIDLERQQAVNRWYARWGSERGHLATIDLSSASDTISLAMCRRFLPPDMMRVLDFCRSDRLQLPDGSVISPAMVSTMGNAFTFSLQTVLFSCAVVACLIFRDKPVRWRGFPNLWGVNGDDIICPSSVYSDVAHLLALLGFKVNRDKSFSEGPFRESCGGDYFLGRGLRGVYLKGASTYEERCAGFNKVIRFSARTSLMLPNLALALLPERWCRVPRHEDMSAGIHVPLSLARGNPRDANGSVRYKAQVAVNPRLRFLDSAVVAPKTHRSRVWNPSGVELAILRRTLSGSGGSNTPYTSLRSNSDEVRYQTRRRVTPHWDNVLFSRLFMSPDSDVDWTLWETIVTWLLGNQ